MALSGSINQWRVNIGRHRGGARGWRRHTVRGAVKAMRAAAK